MNAHLHVLEAYTLLYQCWKDDGLEEKTRILHRVVYGPHLRLFKEDILICSLIMQWNSLVEMDSYGHDVEAGWLLCEAARVLEDRQLDGYGRIGLRWM